MKNTHRITLCALALSLLMVVAPAAGQLCSQGCVTTQAYDNSRDNVNPNESILKATTIKTLTASSRSDLLGVVYAQPLYLSGISIGGTSRNVLYLATQENYVYALDEANFTGAPLWIANLNNISVGETAVPDSKLPVACANITPEVGITGTPVIDTTITSTSPNPIMYVVSKHYYVDSQQVAHISQRLNALDVTTGSPVGAALDIGSAFQGMGAAFQAASQNQRAGLALTHDASNNPVLMVTWGSHCDAGTYNGIIGLFSLQGTAPNASVTALAVLNDESAQPNKGGIWMAGAAPAVDDVGALPTYDAFLASGTGGFDGKTRFGQSVLRFRDLAGDGLNLAGFYTPNGWKILTNGSGANCPAMGALALPAPESGTVCVPSDVDLGSGGVILARPSGITLSYNQTPENFVVLAGGKEGVVYVNSPLAMATNKGSDPSNPSLTACSTSGPNSAVQCFGAAYLPANCCGGARDFGLRGSSAFWAGPDAIHGNLFYVVGVQDTAIRAFQMDATHTTGQFVTTPFGLGEWQGVAGTTITYPGASPVITWNQAGGPASYLDAILWVVDNGDYQRLGSNNQRISAGRADLYAYAAEPDVHGKVNLTSFVDKRNGPGAVKFTVPTVVNGHIYLAGQKIGAAFFCSGAPCYGAVTMWH